MDSVYILIVYSVMAVMVFLYIGFHEIRLRKLAELKFEFYMRTEIFLMFVMSLFWPISFLVFFGHKFWNYIYQGFKDMAEKQAEIEFNRNRL